MGMLNMGKWSLALLAAAMSGYFPTEVRAIPRSHSWFVRSRWPGPRGPAGSKLSKKAAKGAVGKATLR